MGKETIDLKDEAAYKPAGSSFKQTHCNAEKGKKRLEKIKP